MFAELCRECKHEMEKRKEIPTAARENKGDSCDHTEGGKDYQIKV